MTEFELQTDVQLCETYLQKMQIAKNLTDLKQANKQATQKLKEIYNDKKALLKN